VCYLDCDPVRLQCPLRCNLVFAAPVFTSMFRCVFSFLSAVNCVAGGNDAVAVAVEPSMPVLPPQPFAQPAAMAAGRAVRCDAHEPLRPRVRIGSDAFAHVLNVVCHAMPIVPCHGSRVMKKSGSDDDVFSAVGGMELGRHDAASSTAAAAQPMLPAGSMRAAAGREGGAASHSAAQGGPEPQHAGSNPFSAPAIGDLPFSETPSRTLIVRNVAASRSDQDLQHLFEVSTCCCQSGIREHSPMSMLSHREIGMQRMAVLMWTAWDCPCSHLPAEHILALLVWSLQNCEMQMRAMLVVSGFRRDPVAVYGLQAAGAGDGQLLRPAGGVPGATLAGGHGAGRRHAGRPVPRAQRADRRRPRGCACRLPLRCRHACVSIILMMMDPYLHHCGVRMARHVIDCTRQFLPALPRI